MHPLLKIGLISTLALFGGPKDNGAHPDLIVAPPTIAAGTVSSALILTDQVAETDTQLTLVSSNTANILVPSTVTVQAGESSVIVPILVSPFANGEPVVILASANGVTVGTIVIPTY